MITEIGSVDDVVFEIDAAREPVTALSESRVYIAGLLARLGTS